MGKMQRPDDLKKSGIKTFLAIPLFTEEDAEAFEYFQKFRATLDATTAADLFVGIPQIQNGMVKDLDWLFGVKGAERFPKLKRADLPCLWIEDEEEKHFMLRLPRNQQKLTELLRSVTDAAAKAKSFKELKSDILSSEKNIQGAGMETRLLTALGKIAGLAGISVGILLLIFKKVLEQKFLPQTGLTNWQAYHVILALMILTFGIAAIGIIAWVVGNRKDDEHEPVSVGTLLIFLFLVVAVLVTAGWAGKDTVSSQETNPQPSASPTAQPAVVPSLNPGAVSVLPKRGTSGKVKKTGDHYIDQVEANLAAIRRQGNSSEAQILTILTPLFNRAAFACNSTENWGYMLWAAAKTRLILEDDLNDFKEHPEIRSQVNQAAGILLKMQNDIAKIYGSGFSATEHLQRYSDNQATFVNRLPNVLIDPDQKLQAERLADVQRLRETLAGIMAIPGDPGCK